MNCLHLMAGLGATSGVANIARRFARAQTGRGDAAVLLAPAFKWNPVYFGPLFALEALARAVRADEIWVHCSWTFPVWYGAALAKFLGRKLVVVPEGSFDPKRLGNHARWKKRLVSPLDKWVLRQADEVLALCRDEIDWVRAFESAARVRFERVPTFCDSVRMTANGEDDRREGPLRVLFLGRADDPLKGVRYLEQAAAEINREVGVKSSSSGKDVVIPFSNSKLQLIDLRIVSDHQGEELEHDWAWCDVLCLPTLSENFGLVVAEALERGKRVITTDGAPAWEPPPEAETEVEDRDRPWWNRVCYLRGYREGTDAERVKLLKDALMGFVEHKEGSVGKYVR